MAIFTGTAGADSLTGAADEADTFRFTPATLGAADTVTGGAGAVVDTLQFTAGGSIAPAQFAGVAGIERILHSNAGNSYALAAALVAGGIGGFEVRGGSGADSVDGSALADPAWRVAFIANGGADTLLGGAGNDTFTVLAAGGAPRLFGGGGGADLLVTNPASWSAADAYQGGAGTDRLLFNAAGSIAAAQLAGLASVEEIQLANGVGFALALDDAAVAQAGPVLKVLGGAGGAQLVDASAVSAGAVAYVAGTGADTFLGGAGDDRFEVTEATSTGDLGAGDDVLRLTSKLAQGIIVQGGAGDDVVELFAGGSWDLTGLGGFEEVELLAASTLQLPATEGFRVLGSTGRDVITLGAPRQTVAGFGGDDIVAITAATMLGSVLSGGGQASQDALRLDAAGNYDFRRALITGFEKIEQVAVPGGFSSIQLANQPIEVVLRHSSFVTLGAIAAQAVWGSARNDSFLLGAAGQFVEAGGGNDGISAAPAFLGVGTMLAGGPGTDTLTIRFATAGETANLATGAAIGGIERIQILPDTGTPGLDLTLDATPGIEIAGGAGADTVTAGAASLFGTLGGGDDLLRLVPLSLPGAATLDGGAGTDTLALLDTSAALLSLVVPVRFSGFERVELGALTNAAVTLQGAEAREVLLGAGAMTVTGGDGAERFDNPAAGNAVFGGRGADTIRQTVVPDPAQLLDGGAGSDVILYDLGAGGATTSMPAGWTAETVRLVGSHGFTATAQAGLRVVGDPTLGNAITLAGNLQRADGGGGADTLSNDGGLQTSLFGGNGSDVYVVDAGLQDVWDTPGQVIADNAITLGGGINTLRIQGTGTLTIDFSEHAVSYMDRIFLSSADAAVRLTLTDEMAAQANPFNDTTPGRLLIATTVDVLVGVLLDASAFLAPRNLIVTEGLEAADTLIGGAGADFLDGGSGADSVLGNAGNDAVEGRGGADTLLGGEGHDKLLSGLDNDRVAGDAGDDYLQAGDGADTLIAGEGADEVRGELGGDQITLTEAAAATDRVRYGAADDGTVDIDDAGSVSQTTADSITGFAAGTDRIVLKVAGLGIGAGGVVNVAANAAWDIGAGAVFLFESDSAEADTLNVNDHASLAAIEFAINSDNGAGFGSVAGRTVALVVSNLETQPTRTTGLYLWTDTDGDSRLEAGDVVRLLAVFQGVTANQLAGGGSIELI
jgi:Ca2+-binding RTX toxin-like protein